MLLTAAVICVDVLSSCCLHFSVTMYQNRELKETLASLGCIFVKVYYHSDRNKTGMTTSMKRCTSK